VRLLVLNQVNENYSSGELGRSKKKRSKHPLHRKYSSQQTAGQQGYFIFYFFIEQNISSICKYKHDNKCNIVNSILNGSNSKPNGITI
jgi:hypothetical protein